MVKSMDSESKFWFQNPVQLLISCVTLDEFLNLPVRLFPYQYNECTSMYFIEWFVLNELIHVQFLGQSMVHSNLYASVSSSDLWRKMCTRYSDSTQQKSDSVLAR